MSALFVYISFNTLKARHYANHVEHVVELINSIFVVFRHFRVFISGL